MPVALLSVYDKSGIAELARGLSESGWEIWSSGGTADAIRAAGVAATDVAEITGYPALLGHRVATLHPLVHGGILADRDDPDHLREMEQYGIRPISLVVVNLYPFSAGPGIELIDVGGPALVRAAAKNHAHVAVVVRPQDYELVLNEIRATGAVSAGTRRDLARIAFRTTSKYDAEIADWLAGPQDHAGEPGELPEAAVLGMTKAASLRYGENPHQRGARYSIAGATSWWDDAVQLGGKELSYLNVYDTDAAWSLVHRFDAPACVIVKHANPCGVAVVEGGSTSEAYVRARDCDPVSAFGGIVALNRAVDAETASAIAEIFTEVVVAPAFDDVALDVLRSKQNLRIIRAGAPRGSTFDIRSIDGGLLVQTCDEVDVDRESWRVVTAAQPAADKWSDVEIAWRVAASVSSNAIVLVKDGCAVGIGAGQQNRLDSARIAVDKSSGRAVGGVCASDAFFPFRDGVDEVARAGVAVVVQPGGSMRDAEVISAADELGIAMIFTGERHFRH